MLGSVFQPLMHSLRTLSSVAFDLICLVVLVSRSRRHWQPENLFLRKQLALFQERNVKPHPAHDSTRLVRVILGRMFSWRGALARDVGHFLGSQDLQGYAPVEVVVDGLVDHSHAAFAQFPDKLEVRQALADHSTASR